VKSFCGHYERHACAVHLRQAGSEVISFLNQKKIATSQAPRDDNFSEFSYSLFMSWIEYFQIYSGL
jgi:hypothetical protein